MNEIRRNRGTAVTSNVKRDTGQEFEVRAGVASHDWEENVFLYCTFID